MLSANAVPRVVFLPDTFTEVNGVAHTSRHLGAFARRRSLPLLIIHCGPEEQKESDGAVSLLQLKRGPACFKLDANLDYDPLLWRYANRIAAEIKQFGGELIHITGPGDMGAIGLYLSRALHLPLVISWHTNLHEYAKSRCMKLMKPAGEALGKLMGSQAERASLNVLRQFYRRANQTMAPNSELMEFTRDLTGRPCHLMSRGVDTQLFSPIRRKRVDSKLQIGYVGRLTSEKNVRLLAKVASHLAAKGQPDFELVIVGEGSEDRWLDRTIPQARLTGVLRSEALANAYADMDIFVFPSLTDTFGNVVLEALASGVPAVVTNQGGPKFLVQSGVTGIVAADETDFIESVARLAGDADLRARMSLAAVKYAHEQSWDRVFESVWNVYEEGVARHEPWGKRAHPLISLLSSRMHGRSCP